MSEVLFTQDDLDENFDELTLKRGRSYWRDKAVRDLEITEGGAYLSAKVRGSRSKPYDVTVEIDSLPPIGSNLLDFMITSDCTCPVRMDCKHGAAVCFEALARQTNLSTAPKFIGATPHSSALVSSHLSPQREASAWDTWFNDLAKVEVKPPEQAKSDESVLYILEIGEGDKRNASSARHLSIRPVAARRLKDGGYSNSHRKLEPYNLAQGNPRYIMPEDTAIGKLMQGHNSYSVGFASPPCSSDVFDLVLRRVLETGRCYFHSTDSEPLTLGEEKSAKLGWHFEEDGSQTPALVVDEDQARLVILPSTRPWYVDRVTRQTGVLKLNVPLELAHKFLAAPKIMPHEAASVAEKMAGQTFSGSIMAPRALQFEKRVVSPTACLRLTSYTKQSEWDETEKIHHQALIHFDYDGIVAETTDASAVLRQFTDDKFITLERDRPAEAAFLRRLNQTENINLVPAPYTRPPDAPPSRMTYALIQGSDERIQWLDFLTDTVPALRARGWRVDVDDGFAERFTAVEVDKSETAWQADMREQEGGSWWFSLDLGIMVEGQRVALLPLLVQALKRLSEPTTAAIESLARRGKLYVDLPDGRALALPFERVRDMLTTLIELYDQPLNPDGTMTVPLDLATALSRIDSATKMRWLGGKRLQLLIERLKTFSGLVEILPPRGLKATMRPYQREGLNWLQFLRDYGLSGILADDMGLGKTLQALAHIMVEKQGRRLDRPCLIVCPTSLIPNWQDEAAKFAPRLKVLSLHGKDRATRFDQIETADIVLTTYPLLPRDSETLLPVEWHMVILDEAQAIKNPTSQVTQLACELKARHRLCLTGTPIENHLGEAWSHFAFLMPGMLGSHKNFNKRFRIPIEKHKDSERQALLARRLKPFILRRNKSDVAKELPPKTEIIRHIEFDSAQRDLYETLRLTMHEKVQEAVVAKGFNRSRIIILDALLKLRQACCDPRLVKLTSAKKVKNSAKLDNLMEMLPELIEEGRRILLFSQFTSMLDLIKLELDKAKIPFVEIRGDTTDRRTPVAQFQNGEVPLFLISLKAGGTGLNLTAADTVIHYDPWWNPAVENQATDRAHRIGQNKPVFVYKFIAKGTVEERILDLQNRKRNLASALLDERPDATAAFESNDLDFLFSEAA